MGLPSLAPICRSQLAFNCPSPPYVRGFQHTPVQLPIAISAAAGFSGSKSMRLFLCHLCMVCGKLRRSKERIVKKSGTPGAQSCEDNWRRAIAPAQENWPSSRGDRSEATIKHERMDDAEVCCRWGSHSATLEKVGAEVFPRECRSGDSAHHARTHGGLPARILR